MLVLRPGLLCNRGGEAGADLGAQLPRRQDAAALQLFVVGAVFVGATVAAEPEPALDGAHHEQADGFLGARAVEAQVRREEVEAVVLNRFRLAEVGLGDGGVGGRDGIAEVGGGKVGLDEVFAGEAKAARDAALPGAAVALHVIADELVADGFRCLAHGALEGEVDGEVAVLVKGGPGGLKARAETVVRHLVGGHGGGAEAKAAVRRCEAHAGGDDERDAAGEVERIRPRALVDGGAEEADAAEAVEGVGGEEGVGARVRKLGLLFVLFLEKVAHLGGEAVVLVFPLVLRNDLEGLAAGVGEVEAEAGGGEAPLTHAGRRVGDKDLVGDDGVGVRPDDLEAILLDRGPVLRPVVRGVGAERVVVAEDAEGKERAVAAADGGAGALHVLEVGDAVGGGGAVPKETEARLVKGAGAAAAADDEDDVGRHVAGGEDGEEVGRRDAEDELFVGGQLELGAPGAALLVVGRGGAGERDADKVFGERFEQALVEGVGVEGGAVGVERVEGGPEVRAAVHDAGSRDRGVAQMAGTRCVAS